MSSIQIPDQLPEDLAARMNELEDQVRQMQAAKIGLPTVDEIPASMLTLEDILAIAEAGGEVEECKGVFAKVVPADTCLWLDDEGVDQTWAEWHAKQYPYIVGVEKDGFLYFGCHPGGRHMSATELKAMQDQGVELLDVEQYKAATVTEEDLP